MHNIQNTFDKFLSFLSRLTNVESDNHLKITIIENYTHIFYYYSSKQ